MLHKQYRLSVRLLCLVSNDVRRDAERWSLWWWISITWNLRQDWKVQTYVQQTVSYSLSIALFFHFNQRCDFLTLTLHTVRICSHVSVLQSSRWRVCISRGITQSESSVSAVTEPKSIVTRSLFCDFGIHFNVILIGVLYYSTLLYFEVLKTFCKAP